MYSLAIVRTLAAAYPVLPNTPAAAVAEAPPVVAAAAAEGSIAVATSRPRLHTLESPYPVGSSRVLAEAYRCIAGRSVEIPESVQWTHILGSVFDELEGTGAPLPGV